MNKLTWYYIARALRVIEPDWLKGSFAIISIVLVILGFVYVLRDKNASVATKVIACIALVALLVTWWTICVHMGIVFNPNFHIFDYR